MRLAEELPGSTLRLLFWLGEEAAAHYQAIDEHLQEVWGDVADVLHQHTHVLRTAQSTQETQGEYRITLNFRQKIDENNIEDIESLIEHFITTIEYLDEKSNSV